MKYALAIDIGASSGRHIIGYKKNNEIVYEEIYRFPNGVKNVNDHLVWDVDALFKEILTGLKKAKTLNKIPDVIGIDTWAVDYALLDENNKLIDCVYAYRDKRTEKSIPEVHKLLPHEELYKLCGIQFQPFNTIYQLYEDKMSGRLSKAKSFLMLPDYLHFLLTGVKKQEYTNATSTSMVNADTKTWNKDILNKLGLNKDLFKELSNPGTVMGTFKEDIKEFLGYDAKVVLPATHDTASAVEALDIKDEPYISSGTWSLLGLKVKDAIRDEKSHKGNWSNEGGPSYYRYQKNIMGMWLVQSLRNELCPNKDFVEIAELARKSSFNGIVDVNNQDFLAPTSMKEAFDKHLNKTIKRNLELGDYFRSAYLSLAYLYKESLYELEENTGKVFHNLYIVGGGAKNSFLNELTEQMCQIKVVALPIEATALGNLKILINKLEEK